MSTAAYAPLLLLGSLMLACGDDVAGTAGASESATMITTAAPPSTGTTMEVPTGSGDVSNSGSATDSGAATGTTPTTTGEGGPKLDLGVPDGGFACGCEFNYVWVANSVESTVSKIKTPQAANCGVYGRIQAVG